MFEHFTEKSIRVVLLAQEESRRLGHNFVGTEQMLLGLIGEGSGIAHKTLKHFNINLKDTRAEVEKIIGRGSGFVAVEVPFTPRAKRALEFSWQEARQLGHNYIGTEHLLLGVISDCESVAFRALTALGTDVEKIRPHVIKLLGGLKGPPAPDKQGSAGTADTTQQTARSYGSALVCPNCAERIAQGAVVCRHCGHGLSDDHFVECKFCKERIRREAIKCRYCQSMFDESAAGSS